MSVTKIGVVGTHSTGKTTFIRRLKDFLDDKGFNVYIIEELARKSRKDSLKRFTIQKIIIEEQIKKERAMKRRLEMMDEKDNGRYVMITDRTTIDNFAYLELSGFEGKRVEKRFLEKIRTNDQSYDIIIYSPLIHKIEEDGFRDKNELFRLLIDEEIRERLEGIQNVGSSNTTILKNGGDVLENVLQTLKKREIF
jgi:nicotinamide riboside kinase